MSFWFDVWAGDRCLKEKFPRLFTIASFKNAKVREMGIWDGQSWQWHIPWRRSLFQWELSIEEEFLQYLGDIKPCVDRSDTKVWKWSNSGSYSVKSCIEAIQNLNTTQKIAPHLV